MKAGQKEKAEIDPRYAQLVMQNVVRDVFDALTELITNSDDSYDRLYSKRIINKDGGPVLIEIERRIKEPSRLIVKDRAEGMTLAEMRKKIKRIGGKTSGNDNRGFMGRGAKECAALGKATFESIKDGKYYKSEFNSQLEFIPYEPAENATPETRQRLGIIRGNGTAVTIEISRDNSIPRFETLLRDLPYHLALRDILSKASPSKVTLTDGERTEPLLYQPPEGELISEEEFEVPGYSGVMAKLTIWRSPEPLDGYSARFRRSGFAIKGKRAIHECCLLSDEFEKDPIANKYFGRIVCSYIDQLAEEYDEYRAKEILPPDNNFCLIIDPNRQNGLRRDHPFTTALFNIPIERLRALVNADRDEIRKKTAQVANKETEDRLNRLAKAANSFLRQGMEDSQEISIEQQIDNKSFAKEGIMIFPTYFNIAIGEKRKLALYVKSTLVNDPEKTLVTIKSDNAALSVLDSSIKLEPHKTRNNTLMGYFSVQGKTLAEKVLIEAVIKQGFTALAEARIVDKTLQEHLFNEFLEFEHQSYQVRQGKKKSLQLFAKYPELVTQEIEIEITSTDTEGVLVRGRCKLIPVSGTNFACGSVIVQGRRLNASAKIEAQLERNAASAIVKVVKKDDNLVPISIKLEDKDYGNFRAMWAEHEGHPNLLLISAKHKSLRRYLGPPPEFSGQNEPHFRILLAEIVAESVCRKKLVAMAQAQSWLFDWADEKENPVIANSVIAELQKLIREFSVTAHDIMLLPNELQKITSH